MCSNVVGNLKENLSDTPNENKDKSCDRQYVAAGVHNSALGNISLTALEEEESASCQ